jgi:hypothetical protein
MGIFKKTVKYSKASKDLDSKIKSLDEGLKKTGVISEKNGTETLYVEEKQEENIPKIIDEIKVVKEEEKLYNWRETLLEENIEEEILEDNYETPSLTRVENYISESNKDLILIRDQIFKEISEQTLLDLPEIKNKISKVLEIYEQLQEGLLNEPPETKNEDPLTPLNQNFVTTEDLNKHYTLFINRVQEQLATIGGGGETRLKYLDDVVGIATNASLYDGKFLKYDHTIGKFVFEAASGGGGSGEYANVAGIATYAQTAGIATYASVAGISTYSSTAGVSTYASLSGIATYASISGVSTYSQTSGISTYASTAGLSTYASTAGVSTVAQGLTGTPNIVVGTITAVDASFSGNVSIAGTLTYEDVTNVESLGIITARSGIFIGPVTSIGATITSSGNASFSGVVTAFSFVKDDGTSSQFLKADGSVDSSVYATQTYVGLATVGLASVSFVNSQVGLATVGLASVSFVNSQIGLSTSGLLSFTGSGSNLTGIVTYITAGTGISITQSTGNVTIAAVGSGGGETLDQTLALGNSSTRGMGVGVITATTLNVTGIATIGTGIVTTLRGTNINYTGISTFTSTFIINANVSGVATIGTGIVTTLRGTTLNYTGVSTFSSGPVLISSTGTATTTGTASQPLQVTGGAYVSGSIGVGTTNPRENLDVIGTIGVQASGAINRFEIQHNTAQSSLDFIFI